MNVYTIDTISKGVQLGLSQAIYPSDHIKDDPIIKASIAIKTPCNFSKKIDKVFITKEYQLLLYSDIYLIPEAPENELFSEGVCLIAANAEHFVPAIIYGDNSLPMIVATPYIIYLCKPGSWFKSLEDKTKLIGVFKNEVAVIDKSSDKWPVDKTFNPTAILVNRVSSHTDSNDFR